MNYNRTADYYDQYVKFDADIPFFIKETSNTSGEVLELMSGTGRLSLPLVEKGIKLSCVDSSQPMLRILRNKLENRGLSAPVIQQNICELSLDKQYELIFIPFHSFAELVTTSDQLMALNKIYKHLSDNGRFICTLHNPSIRLKTITNQLHLIGRYLSGMGNTTLLVWSAENYNPLNHIVDGVQVYEDYDAKGEMLSRTIMELNFCLLERAQFENLATSSGFKISRLYGDYSYSEFKEKSSPVMVFELHR